MRHPRAVPRRDRRRHRGALRETRPRVARAAARGRPGVVSARARLQRGGPARSRTRSSSEMFVELHAGFMRGLTVPRRGVANDGRCRHLGRPTRTRDARRERRELLQRDAWSREELRRVPARASPRADPPRGRALPYYRAVLGAGAEGAEPRRPADLAQARAHGAVRRIVTDRRLRLADLEPFLARADAGALYLGRVPDLLDRRARPACPGCSSTRTRSSRAGSQSSSARSPDSG